MNLIKNVGVALVVLMIVAVSAAPAFAQPAPTNAGPVVSNVAPFYGAAIGAGLGAGLIIIGAGQGFARIGGSALESMARQPETAGQVQTAMIIIGALLEGATMLGLVICLLLSLRA